VKEVDDAIRSNRIPAAEDAAELAHAAVGERRAANRAQG
jgi:hypothetical protein